MWVKDYMCRWVNTIEPQKSIADAAKKMVEKKTNSLIVVDKEGKPIGLITSHILIQETVPEYLKDNEISAQFGAEGVFDKYAAKVKNQKLEDVMYSDFHTLSIDDAMIEAAAYASKEQRRTIPVVDKEGKLTGAITRTCIKNALYNAIFKDKKIDPTIDRNGEFKKQDR